MLERLIEFSLKRRSAVLLLALAIAAAGAASLRELDVDAFPDTTPVQVQVNASVPALGPEEVERQITSPIEQALAGLPKLTALRSISKFGLSQTTLTFADGTDLYFARQVVGERLQSVALPEGVDRPRLGPVSTGLGEVFHYLVRGRGADPTELRTIHDWTIRPALRTVPGVAEVNSWGGFEKQYQIVVDPQKLLRHGLTLASVIEATERNNRNVGGGSISQATGMLLVQGQGRPDSIARIKEAAIATKDGVPVRLGDVADVVIGHEVRRGAVTAQGEGEVVLGLGFMLVGENSKVVAGALRDKLREVQQTLPRNVETIVAYDRTELVDVVLDTVRANLFEGGLLVIAVLFAFLGRLRAAFLVALAIPLSMLFAFSGMLRFGVAASLLSLGAIDFGMIVDSSVVMVENCVRRLAEPGAVDRPRRDVVRDAAMEVRRPTLFGELIVAIVYLPILTLEGIEGKLFRPMALTVVFALLGSMIFSVTLAPTLASWMLPRGAGPHREPWPMRLAHRLHEPILRFAMRRKAAVATLALAMLVFAFGIVAPSLGTEFVPRLSEGSIVVNVVRLAGADLAESIAANTRMERALLAEFPDEVERVWSRIGTAEIATDPMGVELTDLFVSLKPRIRWTRARTQAELTVAFEKTLRQFPGQKLSFSQPIELRLA